MKSVPICYIDHKTGESDHMNAHIQTEKCVALPPAMEPEALRALIAKWRESSGWDHESGAAFLEAANELDALVRASSPPEPEAETPSRIITERLIANAAALRASSPPPPVSPDLSAVRYVRDLADRLLDEPTTHYKEAYEALIAYADELALVPPSASGPSKE